MNDNYRIALLYAHKLTGDDYHIDIVHDAYLNFYRHYNKNLFEQNINVVKVIVRRRWNELHRYNTYVVKGERFTRQWVEVKDYHSITSLSPLDFTILSELESRIDHLPVSIRYAVIKRSEGYSLKEIGDDLGVNQSTVLRHIQKSKNILHGHSN